MSTKLRVGIIGATGMVGQRLVSLLSDHPNFVVTLLAASSKSANKTYAKAVEGRWCMNNSIPESIAFMKVTNAADVNNNSSLCDFVFCAVDMSKEETLALEEAYAKAETPVISTNSAARKYPDVPMLIPEINSDHIEVIATQRIRLGTKHGFIAVKPNCSIQSYVPALEPLRALGVTEIVVSTYQALSGAGKTFNTWPEMIDNVIPYIKGEEEKSEQEPLKIWGTVKNGEIINASGITVSAQCIRVPVSDGHMASVFIRFNKKPAYNEILDAWKTYKTQTSELNLHSSPKTFLTYFEDDNRPQTSLDRDLYNGMGISIGRLREDTIFDYKLVCLSHNTLRGAAGGAVLMAELLYEKGYLSSIKV